MTSAGLSYGDAMRISPTQPILDANTLLPVSRTYRITVAVFVSSFAWISVISSNVSSIAYHKDKRLLYVQFRSSGRKASTYIYSDVEEGAARDMFNCSSMGKFVHYRLKDRYPVRPVLGIREELWPGLGTAGKESEEATTGQ